MANGRLVGICGSLRKASHNRKLMLEAARTFDAAAFIDGNIRFPLYDEDLEAADGIPPGVALLADQVASADAAVVVTPEYNKAMSGALKNALDWMSRVEGDPWRDKPVAILSAAAGRAGGERSQMTLRHAMTAFRPRLLYGPEVTIANAPRAFDASGRLVADRARALLAELMDALRAAAGLARA